MTILWVETHDSRQRNESISSDSTATLQWVGWGSHDDDEMESALRAVMPMTFRLLPLVSWRVSPMGGDVWEASAEYSTRPPRERPDTGEVVFSFDTQGATVKRMFSLGTTSYAPPGETAPTHAGAINVQRRGGDVTVEGVDVVIPSLKFTLQWRTPAAQLTLAYLNVIHGLTGKVNNASFWGFAPGEVLFLGAAGSQKSQGDVDITYNFLASANVTDLVIEDITVASKLGHQYLWFDFETDEDTTAKKTVKTAIAANVETVYESADFSLLGIGV